MTANCRHCGDPTEYEVSQVCARCLPWREMLDEMCRTLPYAAAISLVKGAESHLRSAQQRDWARQHPEHYGEGWRKRRKSLQSVSEKPRK